MSVRPGSRLGVDVGTARVGVARSDPSGLLSTPVCTLARNAGTVAEVIRLIREFEVCEVVVGLPLSLSGERTRSTQDAVDFAKAVSRATEVPVRLVDERLSTVSAQRALHSTGKTARSSRPVIDQVAATIILQHALDLERSAGTPPGELVRPDEG